MLAPGQRQVCSWSNSNFPAIHTGFAIRSESSSAIWWACLSAVCSEAFPQCAWEKFCEKIYISGRDEREEEEEEERGWGIPWFPWPPNLPGRWVGSSTSSSSTSSSSFSSFPAGSFVNTSRLLWANQIVRENFTSPYKEMPSVRKDCYKKNKSIGIRYPLGIRALKGSS